MNIQKKLCGIMAGFLCIILCGTFPVQAQGYWPAGPNVEAVSAVVMEASTGAILYEKNPHEQLYPASITKIMTTLLALENSDLQEEVTFSYESVHNIDRNSTHISRDTGEIMTMEQCLYAVMLGSANECAYAVAEHTGKGYDNFVAMMNEKAASLGCTDTHFNNPHGLTDPEHYTSAYDMALISQAALENETFRLITGSKRYTIPRTNKHPNEETPLVNHHKMLTSYQGEQQYLYKDCIGGKTGYTDLARNTLVTFAERDGMTLICVVMKDSVAGQYTDSKALMDYCFSNFSMWNVSEHESAYMVKGTANGEIFGTEGSFVELDEEDQIVLPKNALFTDASYKAVTAKGEEQVVAALQYTYDGHVVGKARLKLVAPEVEPYAFEKTSGKDKGSFLEVNLKYILLGVLTLVLLAAIIFGIHYFANNFYVIRHNRTIRRNRKKRFKTDRKRNRRSNLHW